MPSAGRILQLCCLSVTCNLRKKRYTYIISVVLSISIRIWAIRIAESTSGRLSGGSAMKTGIGFENQDHHCNT